MLIVKCSTFPGNTCLAATEGGVLAVSVDENGFEVDDQGFNFPTTSSFTLDSTYSFELNDKHILCIGKVVYQYDTKKKMGSKLPQEMPHTREGAACLSFGKTVWIFGGCVDGVITSAIDVVREDFTICRAFATLPFPLKHHTVTKISETEFILCGGQNTNGNHVSDIFYGRVELGIYFGLPQVDWNIGWAYLKHLNAARSKHCAIFIKNQLVVVGGVTGYDNLDQSRKSSVRLRNWGLTTWSPSKNKTIGANVETFKIKRSRCRVATYRGLRANYFRKNNLVTNHLISPLTIFHKGCKDVEVKI